MKEEEEKEMLRNHDAMKSGVRGMYSRQGKGDHTPKDSEHRRERERFDLNMVRTLVRSWKKNANSLLF